MSPLVDLSSLAPLGLAWQPNGQATLSGALLELADHVDQSFLQLARTWGAREYRFPTFISAAELNKLDYFRSFPHLVSFPVSLQAGEANLERFTQGEILNERGELLLTETAPVKEVLTPAACYHLYIHEQGSTLDQAQYYTTRNTCFRREQYYSPLRRQWGFAMREIVCLGSLEEVTAFLAKCRSQLEALLTAVGLPVRWLPATDPFFQPSRSPKYIAQRVNPTKTEAVFGDDLAIASVNLHQDHFGHTFDIARAGASAFTGCVAMGIERWLYAVVTEHGVNPRHWPIFPRANTRGTQPALRLQGDA